MNDNNKSLRETALGGILNNPVFVLVLGICPLIGTSTTFFNSLAMGLATLFVLTCSNIFISLLRKVIPEQVRIPSYILIIAVFVTIVQLFMDKYLPTFYDSVGGFIKLIAVNCVIFARAEGFARKHENSTLASLIDALSTGLGYLFAICLLGATRQFLSEVLRITIFSKASGGFIALGLLMALFNAIFYYSKQIVRKRSLKGEVL